MRKIAMTAAGLSLAAGVLGAGLAVAPSADAATACPSGAFCIRETNGTILSKNIFYSYGNHNLSNVTGKRVLINNQTGGAGFKLCFGYSGTRCSAVDRAKGTFSPYDMTPINSVVLVK
ncbi:hypothetical protein OHB13_35220 [Streptomyces sp. NBC_00440]|uniref:hypothetical protein n=1 Tax=unclassified Streptomyces TaxID=2593676 RepID=UPI002E1A5A77|nr:hypothetical protein OG221_02210 [Streptomyces sp. NBC_00932]